VKKCKRCYTTETPIEKATEKNAAKLVPKKGGQGSRKETGNPSGKRAKNPSWEVKDLRGKEKDNEKGKGGDIHPEWRKIYYNLSKKEREGATRKRDSPKRRGKNPSQRQKPSHFYWGKGRKGIKKFSLKRGKKGKQSTN